MTSALDLEKIHFKHRHRDLTVFGTWWLAEDSGPRPCMVILPTDQSKWRRISEPCVVMLDQAWVWSEEIGDGAHAARVAYEFAEALGHASVENAMRVRSIIVDHLGDLLSMPPMPAAMRETEVIGEATVRERETGKTVKEGEITEQI